LNQYDEFVCQIKEVKHPIKSQIKKIVAYDCLCYTRIFHFDRRERWQTTVHYL